MEDLYGFGSRAASSRVPRGAVDYLVACLLCVKGMGEGGDSLMVSRHAYLCMYVCMYLQ